MRQWQTLMRALHGAHWLPKRNLQFCVAVRCAYGLFDPALDLGLYADPCVSGSYGPQPATKVGIYMISFTKLLITRFV